MCFVKDHRMSDSIGPSATEHILINAVENKARVGALDGFARAGVDTQNLWLPAVEQALCALFTPEKFEVVEF
jgi:hypothetical protein